jgi:hypothetical protein
MPEITPDPLAKWNLIAQWCVAFGTLAVAIIAIWGDWFRSKVAAPKLSLSIHNARGTATQFTNGPRAIFYHLKVSNSRRWAPARNCQVFLKEVYRRGPDHVFHPVPLPVPVPFVWAPAEFSPPAVSVPSEQILDFGLIAENSQYFLPRLYVTPNDFQGSVGAQEAVRYSLEVLADGYASRQYQVFEVSWNGRWTDNLDQMSQNLVIREIHVGDEAQQIA